MNPKQKRPILVTILAIVFLWIGCLGTLIFPVLLFAGMTSMRTLMWKQPVSVVIHSEFWLNITSYLFITIWFLAYVAYAFIGYGLWKLRNWARITLMALMVFFAVVSVLALPFFVRPATMAIAVVIGSVPFYVWIIWYLKRPRVCFAFGAWPSTVDLPPGLSKIGKAWVVAGIVASLALYCAALMNAIEIIFRSTEIYQITLREAQNTPCVAAKLGIPLTPGWGFGGGWEENSTNGSANLNIPVHGPKGKGRLKLEAEKKSGIWKITSLVLVHESERIQIVPSVPNSSCQ